MEPFRNGYEPPAIPGYVFWSVFSSDEDTKSAVLDDEGGRAYAIAKTAGSFDIPVDDVRAELFEHPRYGRRVWHGYVKDTHRAKVLYQMERMALMLEALERMTLEDE